MSDIELLPQNARLDIAWGGPVKIIQSAFPDTYNLGQTG